jgi:hypothetical protein
VSTLKILNGSELETFSVLVHPQKPNLGKRPQFKSSNLYVDFDDANTFAVGEKVTLINWGNVLITKIDKNEQTGCFALEGNSLPEDKDYKSTKKINWLA